MRIHTVVALYVFGFSFFFHFSPTQYAVLCLTISAVLAAELFNTVAEELSDLAAASFNPAVRIIKDMASGGVLVSAVFSVVIGVCLFWNPPVFRAIAACYVARPALLAGLLALTAAAVVFVVLGPIGIRDLIRKKRKAGKKYLD